MMLNILAIVQIEPNDSLCFEKSQYTAVYVKTITEVNRKFYIYVEDTETGKRYYANLSRMLVDQASVANISSWEDLEEVLTLALLNNYKEPVVIPNNIFSSITGESVPMELSTVMTTNGINPTPVDWVNETERPTIISVDHHYTIDVGYTDVDEPTHRNDPAYRRTLTDVVFTQLRPKDPEVNLKNCLPIINGRTYRPIVYGGELFAKDAMATITKSSSGTPPVLLVDFSIFGNIHAIGLSKCVPMNTDKRITLRLPKGTSLENKSFILVIEGRMFMSGECTINGASEVTLNPYVHDLQTIRMSNIGLEDGYVPGTTSIDIEPMSKAYFDTLFEEQRSGDNFILIIDDTRLQYHMLRPNYRMSAKQLMFTQGIGGLLMRVGTREIVDYTRHPSGHGTIVSYAHPIPLYRLQRYMKSGELSSIGFRKSTIDASEYITNVDDDGYVMIDVFQGVAST